MVYFFKQTFTSNNFTIFIYNLPHNSNVRDISGWFHSRSVSLISLGEKPGTCFVKFRDTRYEFYIVITFGKIDNLFVILGVQKMLLLDWMI